MARAILSRALVMFSTRIYWPMCIVPHHWARPQAISEEFLFSSRQSITLSVREWGHSLIIISICNPYVCIGSTYALDMRAAPRAGCFTRFRYTCIITILQYDKAQSLDQNCPKKKPSDHL